MRDWTIWSIKSPWLRIPAAWLYAVLTVVLFVALLIAFILVGAVKGAMKEAHEFRKLVAGLHRVMWRAMTSTERQP